MHQILACDDTLARGATLEQLLQPLAPSLVASRRALLAKAD